MASDGLWDNLFEDQILQIVERDAANKATLLCEVSMHSVEVRCVASLLIVCCLLRETDSHGNGKNCCRDAFFTRCASAWIVASRW